MIDKIIQRLTACGFIVKPNGNIYQRSANTRRLKKKGQLNSDKNNVFFYASNVNPFKEGANSFKDILGSEYVYNPNAEVLVQSPHGDLNQNEPTIKFTFEQYHKTTKQRNHFNTYLNKQAPNLSNIYDIRGIKNGYLENATLFPYIDYNNNFTTAKIVQYNSITGKRNKDVSANYFHTYKPIIKELNVPKQSKKLSCFFGEHLLAHNTKPVVIVEAEKTAIILSMIFDDIVFLASGGANLLKGKSWDFLINRDVYLYPDSGVRSWFEIGKKRNWFVSEVLENPIVKDGDDVADYLEHPMWDKIEAELKKIGNRSIEISKEFNFSYKEKPSDKFCSTITKELGLIYYNEAFDKEREKYGHYIGRHFKISNKQFYCITANVDVNRYDFIDGKKVKPTEKTLLKRLEHTFRVLKKLNPEENICNHFEKILNHILENGNYIFNKEFILQDLMLQWDNDTNIVSEYVKKRDWAKLSDNIRNEVDFQKYLWRDRKRYDTFLLLKELEPLLKENRYIQLSDVGLSSKRTNSFIANLIKTYNETVLGCNTINNYNAKVKVSQYLQHVEAYTNHFKNTKKEQNFATLYKRTYIVWQKNVPTFKMPNQNQVETHTMVAKRIVREYFNFQPKRNALKNLKTIIEYYIANPNDIEVEKLEKRLQPKNTISLTKMKRTLLEQRQSNGITCKEAFDYPLDFTHSALNVPQSEAMQKDTVFLYSWILFNYPDISELEKFEVYRNPVGYLLQENKVLHVA
jgi:hypothetical protein